MLSVSTDKYYLKETESAGILVAKLHPQDEGKVLRNTITKGCV